MFGATAAWISRRHEANALHAPMSIYEVHLGSWRRVPEEGNRSLTYRETAPLLAAYAQEMGFTHVEFLPVMEHPFYGSWGYQTLGYFAPSSRFGTPQDFMYLVDVLHQHGIGVILDWVPSHFPGDEYGLAYFDGTHLFEHMDPRQAYTPTGKATSTTGRNEVSAFLISSAMFWLELSIDGLRVVAVASMLISTTRARKGSGWRTRSEEKRIWTQSLSQTVETKPCSVLSGRTDHSRRIHRLGNGVASGVRRRTRFRDEMEHGMDARHA
jgi:1,4-alpha-glucan branching enzyme